MKKRWFSKKTKNEKIRKIKNIRKTVLLAIKKQILKFNHKNIRLS